MRNAREAEGEKGDEEMETRADDIEEEENDNELCKSFFGDPEIRQESSGQNYLSAPGYYPSASGRANHNVFSNAARGTKLVTPIALEGPGPRGTVFLTAISRSQG